MQRNSRRSISRAITLCVFALASANCGDKLLGIGPTISVTPTSLDFGSVVTNSTNNQIRVSVSNTGSAALSISSIAVSSDPNNALAVGALLTTDCNDAVRSGSTTLSPGECARFTVTWMPTTAGAAAGAVEIDSDDLQNPAVTLPVSGNATAPLPCTPACSTSELCCDNSCVDTQTDPNHCGGCNACPSGNTCVAGVCQAPAVNGCDNLTAPCASPDLCCNHECVDVSSTGGICPCTGNGTTSNFDVGSIIIPMDVCWQRGEDITSTPSYCNAANAKTTSDDSPLKAYGLVFFLIRHQVTVYVAIDPMKATIDASDMALVSLDGTPPVTKYNWATGTTAPLPDQTQNEISYRGGPFLIDASQHDRVMQLLATDPDFAQFRTAGTITVHVSTVGFQSPIAKSITTPPSRIALLSPAGDDSTYQILVRYLTSAGLNFAGAGGTAAAPGVIYDQLQEADFLPNFAGSNLKKNGYALLWSPHWDGGTANTPAQLATISDYVNAGGDLFAECAAIGTLEGFAQGTTHGGGFGGGGGGGNAYPGSTGTRFLSTLGMAGNTLTTTGTNQVIPGPFSYGGLASVFAQRGDFPFYGFEGAITDYHPNAAASSTWDPGVVRYVYENDSTGSESDLFTSIDGHAEGKGTVVYLSGHDYSYGGENDRVLGVTAGSRLVLNTLFSLGTNNVCSQ